MTVIVGTTLRQEDTPLVELAASPRVQARGATILVVGIGAHSLHSGLSTPTTLVGLGLSFGALRVFP